ncbi:HutD family protein [[Enterobacter] lignolyticus]|uniref:HutD-family protein n=1 Tax=Enterobacter lignolyticus (strain SCF1) TaxID=701347 RepID=E3G4F5_ENTLS|nr:HutD family protein [[Enterobacter] lignolyticus]ADO48268.1 protein of unknown function DUF886 [[Enterobacter] lignolyticus SCF1]
MITSFTLASLPVTRWQNGAGETREIVRVAAADAPFLWRASIATLQADGPFSRFDGVDRVIVLLEGAPLWLRGGNIEHRLEPGVPWAFAGEWPLASEGIVAPGMDFNIMTQRHLASAQVDIATTAQRPEAEGVACVLKGRWQMAGADHHAGGGIWWQEESPGDLVPLTADASLILTTIRRVSGR